MNETQTEPRPPEGPFHEFFRFDRAPQYENLVSKAGRQSISFSDDEYEVVAQTLSWIGCANLDRSEIYRGLRRYSVNLLEGHDAEHLQYAIQCWQQLLSLAPERVQLVSGFDLTSETFSRIELDRDEVLDRLENLGEWLRVAAAGEGVVVHWGV